MDTPWFEKGVNGPDWRGHCGTRLLSLLLRNPAASPASSFVQTPDIIS
jgi:hypothetical protein